MSRSATSRAAVALAAALALAGCCPDQAGNRSCFTAGPVTTRAYAISAVAECPALDEGKIYPPGMFTGAIAIVGTGPDPARTVTADWLATRLGPALDRQDLTPTATGQAAVCGPGPAVFFVKLESWFAADRTARAIAAELAADQLQGEILLVIEPPNVLCAAPAAHLARPV